MVERSSKPRSGDEPGGRAAPFRTLAAQLRDELGTGRWSVGSRLPPVAELASLYGLGVNTVRRAVGELVRAGLVRTRQGSGAYVVALPAPIGPSRSVGLVVPMNRHYGAVIDSVETVLRAADVKLLLACTDYDPAAERARAAAFVASGVEGLIIVPTIHTDPDPAGHADSFAELGVPYIFAERRPADSPVSVSRRHSSYVCSDVLGGVQQAICHLKELGRRRIGFHGVTGTPHSAEVLDGYRAALRDLDLPAIPGAVISREQWSDRELAAYVQLAAEHDLDAIYCSSDRDAGLLLPHLRRHGLDVPERIAVVTFNDTVADLAEVPLTTVAPARAEVGELAARALLRAIEAGHNAVVTKTLVLPRFVVRASSGSARTSTLPMASERPTETLDSPN